MPLALSDNQLRLVMAAANPFDPAKRAVLLERIASQLRLAGARRPSDADVERAIKTAMRGLLQAPAA